MAKDVLGSDYESTIAVLGLNGVTLYVWNEDTQQLEEANVGDVFILEERGDQKYFYVKTEPGYAATLDEASGSGMRIISNLSGDYPGGDDARELGCAYEFLYTYGSSNVYNRTIYLGSELIQYHVSYDAAEGTGAPEDTNAYTIMENNVVRIAEQMPSREGYDFDGWSLGTDAATYFSGGYL